VLIRADIPEWGTVHEIVARLDLVGSGFERTLVSPPPPLPSFGKRHRGGQLLAEVVTEESEKNTAKR